MMWFWVFIGGGLGSICRFGIAELLKNSKFQFPVATLVANLLATAILAFFLYSLSSKIESQTMRLFIVTGFCGGFSTFSTFSAETIELFQQNALLAILNVLISVIGGLALVGLLYPKF